MFLNEHGDRLIQVNQGHGADIASQRADDLDQKALEHIRQMQSFAGIAKIRALDLACGLGGQGLRMARIGAHVIAADKVDTGAVIETALHHSRGSITFRQLDMTEQDSVRRLGDFHVIVMQRAIHYLPYLEAKVVLLELHQRLMRYSGRLFISASGMNSELGDWYDGKSMPVEERFTRLAEPMRVKHGIYAPVCLYREDELVELLQLCGFRVEEIFTSAFGNLKAVARYA